MSKDIEHMDETKVEIEAIGLNAIKEFFEIDPKTLDKETLVVLHCKAKLAMQFEREIGVSRRAVELNYLRVFKLIAEDKTELKKYIKTAMPKYYPK